MVRFELSETIDRPPAEVFRYLTDPKMLPEWSAGVSEARQDSEGPIGVGTRLTEVRKFLGRRMESSLVVTEYEPDRRFSLKVVSGPVPFEIRQTLEPAGGGTRLSIVGEGEPGGFFKLAEPIVARAAERRVRSDYETLKDLLGGRE